MRVDAFITRFDDNKKFDVVYYHTPSRWLQVNLREIDIQENDWSPEIKFLADNGVDVSDGIKNLPNDTGGIYLFFIKGILVTYFENYLAYVGRAQYTNAQNLRQRCTSYYYEFFKEDRRPKVARMIEKWGPYLYVRYYPSVDNIRIQFIEKKLINAILPPFNDEIPEITFKEPENAF